MRKTILAIVAASGLVGCGGWKTDVRFNPQKAEYRQGLTKVCNRALFLGQGDVETIDSTPGVVAFVLGTINAKGGSRLNREAVSDAVLDHAARYGGTHVFTNSEGTDRATSYSSRLYSDSQGNIHGSGDSSTHYFEKGLYVVVRVENQEALPYALNCAIQDVKAASGKIDSHSDFSPVLNQIPILNQFL